MATLVMNGNGAQFRVKSKTATAPKVFMVTNDQITVVDVIDMTEVISAA